MSRAVVQRRKPARVEVPDAAGRWLATLTEGAYTATLAGPVRTFAEPAVAATVTHSTWVRTLPATFDGKVDATWLECALRANEHAIPDVLAIAMQYIERAPALVAEGSIFAGMADYGPWRDGAREEGADFNDYLGVTWTYPGKVDKPEKRQWQCLDCSGFMRIVWGYRHHLPGAGYADTVPLCLEPRADRSAIPRRAFQMYEAAPGVLVVPDSGAQVADFSSLGVGDLVFFDADESEGTQIDHLGMYLGLDAGKHHRFISSRKGANGPTFGDYKGKSILDGTGLYARSFRAIRRL